MKGEEVGERDLDELKFDNNAAVNIYQEGSSVQMHTFRAEMFFSVLKYVILYQLDRILQISNCQVDFLKRANTHALFACTNVIFGTLFVSTMAVGLHGKPVWRQTLFLQLRLVPLEVRKRHPSPNNESSCLTAERKGRRRLRGEQVRCVPVPLLMSLLATLVRTRTHSLQRCVAHLHTDSFPAQQISQLRPPHSVSPVQRLTRREKTRRYSGELPAYCRVYTAYFHETV